MNCYLCGKNSAPIRVERHHQPDEVYQVCTICDERGLYCFTCEIPLGDRDDKFPVDLGWGLHGDEFDCERCAERQFDDYMEARVF